jgi:hypothetical protein
MRMITMSSTRLVSTPSVDWIVALRQRYVAPCFLAHIICPGTIFSTLESVAGTTRMILGQNESTGIVFPTFPDQELIVCHQVISVYSEYVMLLMEGVGRTAMLLLSSETREDGMQRIEVVRD